jgi:tetratricopeptide (TPR) repeat protein
MRQSLILCAVAAVLLAAGPALAQQAPPKPLIPPSLLIPPTGSVVPPPAPPQSAPAAASAQPLQTQPKPAPPSVAASSQAINDTGTVVAGQAAAPSCLPEIVRAERRYGIPSGLLVSIGLVESGRRDPNSGLIAPWPWAINALGQGNFFATLDQATQGAGALLAKNIAKVDVGCMQVDLYHHPHAFMTLAAAFDPETNVDYAARFLRDLYAKTGSWPAAAAAYHSGDPAEGALYVTRVLYYWKGLGLRPEMARSRSQDAGGQRGFVISVGPQPLDVAAAFFARSDYVSAGLSYRAILEANPDDQDALLGMATVLAGEHQDGEARLYFERALAANPDNNPALAGLLAVIARLPPEQRLTSLLSAREVARSSPEIWSRIAAAEAERGIWGDAAKDMAEAVRLAPDDQTFRLNYALLLDRKGDQAGAVQAYIAFLRAYDPDRITLTVPIESVRNRLAYLESRTR